jgi:tetratricopeptide (TPR) repeat protein
MLANVLKASPGKERATKLVELSAHERSTGHYKEAIEFAILGSSEAERHGLDNELGQALMELARAHRSKGDLDNAIGASLRATLVNGTYHSGSRTEALLQLAELYVSAGHPQKALEHLEDAKSTTAADRMDRTRYLRTETAAKAMILNPDKLEEHCNRYMEEAVRSGDKSLQLDLLATKAMAQARSGKYQSALTTEEEVLKLAIALGPTIGCRCERQQCSRAPSPVGSFPGGGRRLRQGIDHGGGPACGAPSHEDQRGTCAGEGGVTSMLRCGSWMMPGSTPKGTRRGGYCRDCYVPKRPCASCKVTSARPNPLRWKR